MMLCAEGGIFGGGLGSLSRIPIGGRWSGNSISRPPPPLIVRLSRLLDAESSGTSASARDSTTCRLRGAGGHAVATDEVRW